MTPTPDCDRFEEIVEALASGDLAPDDATRVHLAGCERCTASLALARAVHRALAAQAPPAVRSDFTAAVQSRLRRERWRSEQVLDVAFNVVLAIVALLTMGGLYAVFAYSGLGAVSADLLDLFTRAATVAAERTLPQMRIYALATVGLVTGLAVWWWAERRFEM